MSHDQLKSRGCPEMKFFGPAKLPQYKLVFSGSSPNWAMGGTADVRKSDNSIVWGGLFLLDDHCMNQLDFFEHVPERRKRINVWVASGSKKYPAVTYVLVSDHTPIKPSRQYSQEVIRGAQDCGLPASYIEEIANKIK